MRRLTAGAIAVGLAWVLVARMGQAGSSAALALGVTLLSAAIVGWLCQFVRVPRVTGYLAIGLLCGPSVANIITEPMARDLQAASRFAVVAIAVVAGLHLDLREMRKRLRRVTGLAGFTVAIAWVALAVVLYLAWPWLPLGGELVGLQRLAAVLLTATLFVGTSPAVTIAVITEERARGPLADLAMDVVVLMELATLGLFLIGLQGARVAFGVASPDGSMLVDAAWSLVGSTAFGAAMGGLFALYLKYVGRELTVVLLALCAGLSGFAPVFGLEPFLAGLAAGIVVKNTMAQAGDVLHDAIEYGAMPVLVLFFAAAGASIHIELLATVGLVALGLSGLRLVGIWTGTRVGGRVTGSTGPDVRLLWRALVPTAGVTLGLAAVVAAEQGAWGSRLDALVIAVVALNQLAGPILFRAALAQAGEIGRSGGGLVVVSNREPWMHEYATDGSTSSRAPTPGGVSVALDALMRERGGVWVAHGAGAADREVTDEHDSVEVPPEAPAYRLRRLWLTPEQIDGYYAGFSNTALWPLCHQAHVRPVMRAEDWETYQQVNRLFAEAVAVEAPPDASVFLNDYHLALVARYLRARRPMLRSALFWHIPWPDVDRLRICPWRREILEGLLSNDLLAFQVQRDQRNFLSAVIEDVGASVSGDTVFFDDHTVRVVSIPIGADFDRISNILGDESLPGEMQRLSTELGLEGKIVGVGVDRLDYTKGIPERIAAISRLLEEHPQLADRFVFVQIGVPSRSDVPGYAEISAEIDELIEGVNVKYGTGPDTARSGTSNTPSSCRSSSRCIAGRTSASSPLCTTA